MDRRTFIGAFAGNLFAVSRVADGQTVGKLPVVGVLVTDVPSNLSLPILVQGLRDLGYVDGKNIMIAVRSAGGTPDAFPARAAELVQLKVNVILLRTAPPLHGARPVRHRRPVDHP